jgi:hypothetical protein
MAENLEAIESCLDSFDSGERFGALRALIEAAAKGEVGLPGESKWTNIHYHTFYSYNGEGYSPCRVAWIGRKLGLAVAGTVDFDVLDAMEEFYEAADLLGLRGSVGVETRVFVPEMGDMEINSPGEPGVAYHMGTGMVEREPGGWAGEFLAGMKTTAQKRNLGLLERVNGFLSPVELDYERDVMPLTPGGNPTERHLCLGYARKAAEVFGDEAELAGFWCEKLGEEIDAGWLPDGVGLQNLIRKKTMKRGGAGYVEPESGSFPLVGDMNRFVFEAGGVPTLAWLNGLTEGESDAGRLLDTAMASGVQAANVIPDRNYTPGKGKEDEKCAKLYEFVEACRERGLPVMAGTEMNSPGQKLVDDFSSAELAPLVDVFYEGAMVVYGHRLLQSAGGIGYCSKWAKEKLANRWERNRLYMQVGESLRPGEEGKLNGVNELCSVDEILSRCM